MSASTAKSSPTTRLIGNRPPSISGWRFSITAVGKARSMGLQSSEVVPERKRKFRVNSRLNREVERALVLPGGARFFAPNRRAENLLKRVLLEARDDRILLQQIHDRRVTFKDLRAAVFLVRELRHVTFGVARLGQRLRTLRDSFALDLLLQRLRLSFEHVQQKLLRGVRPVDVLGRPENLEREVIAVTGEKVMGPFR